MEKDNGKKRNSVLKLQTHFKISNWVLIASVKAKLLEKIVHLLSSQISSKSK